MEKKKKLTYRERMALKRRKYKTLESHYFNKTLQEKAIIKMSNLSNETFLPLGTELFNYKIRNEICGLTTKEWRRMNDLLGILKSI